MNTLSLKILDKELKVACPPEQAERLTEAARLLDSRMREIREHAKAASADRVALMAALNLANDLILARQGQQQNEQHQHTVQRLYDKIDAALELNRQLDLEH